MGKGGGRCLMKQAKSIITLEKKGGGSKNQNE